MKIYFACSSKNIVDHLTNYLNLKNYIVSLGNTITTDWLGKVEKNQHNKNYDSTQISVDTMQIYDEGINSINKADVLIADVSVASGSVGYQIAYTLSQRKPVLCLYSNDFGLKKAPQVILSSETNLLTIRSYDRKNYKSVLKNYLDSQLKNELIKFNFVISKEIETYLTWISDRERRPKSQLLREKVVDKIIKSDSEYQSFLKNQSN